MIYIGADHRGYELKEELKIWLGDNNFEFEDAGNFIYDPEDDYIDPAIKVGEMIEGNKGDYGILLCGSGHGVDMVANKFRNVRAILGFNKEVAIQGREHEDANVLVLPAEWINFDEAQEIVRVFFETEISKIDKYVRRRNRIANLRIV